MGEKAVYTSDMTTEELLKKAKEHLSKGGDDQCWTEPNDLITLIRAGAVVVMEEYQATDKHWVTTVHYCGFTFIAFSGSKLTF